MRGATHFWSARSTSYRDALLHQIDARLKERLVPDPAVVEELLASPKDRTPDRAFDISLARVNDLARAATPALRAVRATDGTLTRA
ncbi:hypothetical protein PUT24_00650, partial [Streptomyces sp. SP17KL33]|nr:hypothetical protein [Streptomyces sp. SP17KL33]